jgi:hypothetical protein
MAVDAFAHIFPELRHARHPKKSYAALAARSPSIHFFHIKVEFQVFRARDMCQLTGQAS